MLETITLKLIVIALTPYDVEETKTVLHKRTGKMIYRTYLKYKCRKSGCPRPVVIFLENSGYRNPYQHLRSCFARGKKQKGEIACYVSSTAEKLGGTIRSHFHIKSLPPRDIALYKRLRYIIMACLPVSHIETIDYHCISKHHVIFSHKRLVSITLRLGELVESRIGMSLKILLVRLCTKAVLLLLGITLESSPLKWWRHLVALYSKKTSSWFPN